MGQAGLAGSWASPVSGPLAAMEGRVVAELPRRKVWRFQGSLSLGLGLVEMVGRLGDSRALSPLGLRSKPSTWKTPHLRAIS